MSKHSAAVTIVCLAMCGAALPLAAETAYTDGSKNSGFVYAKDNDSAIPYRTDFAFSSDGAGLTLTFDVDFPRMDKLKGGAWGAGDNLEIWLDPSGEGKKVMQFAVGPDGSKWDRRAPKAKSEDIRWTAKVSRRADGWTAVVVFPYADLGCPVPKKGDRWLANLCRTFNDESGSMTFSSWAKVGGIFNNPGKFASLMFGSEAEVAEISRRRRVTETAALRQELAAKGLADHFAFKLKRLEEGGPDTLISEIRDELLLLEALRQ